MTRWPDTTVSSSPTAKVTEVCGWPHGTSRSDAVGATASLYESRWHAPSRGAGGSAAGVGVASSDGEADGVALDEGVCPGPGSAPGCRS